MLRRHLFGLPRSPASIHTLVLAYHIPAPSSSAADFYRRHALTRCVLSAPLSSALWLTLLSYICPSCHTTLFFPTPAAPIAVGTFYLLTHVARSTDLASPSLSVWPFTIVVFIGSHTSSRLTLMVGGGVPSALRLTSAQLRPCTRYSSCTTEVPHFEPPLVLARFSACLTYDIALPDTIIGSRIGLSFPPRAVPQGLPHSAAAIADRPPHAWASCRRTC